MPPDGGTKTLLILRHGETSWNRERRIMGTADVPLSEAGRSQCEAVAALLANFAVDAVVTSPLERASQSARIIADALELETRDDEDLQEVKFGRWQGQTYEEVMRDPDYAPYAADPCTAATPGGETIVDVQSRGLAALGRAKPGERTLFVSHGDIIRSTICHYLAIPVSEYRRVRVDNCGLTAILTRGDSAEVKFVNMLADPDRVFESLHWGPSS